MKAVFKTLTYRLVGMFYTFAAAMFLTGECTTAFGVVGIEFVVKTAIFYGHEKAWEVATA